MRPHLPTVYIAKQFINQFNLYIQEYHSVLPLRIASNRESCNLKQIRLVSLYRLRSVFQSIRRTVLNVELTSIIYCFLFLFYLLRHVSLIYIFAFATIWQ